MNNMVCRKCGIEKAIHQFRVCDKNGNRRKSCKGCEARTYKSWATRNRKRLRKYHGDYYKENGAEMRRQNKVYMQRPGVRRRRKEYERDWRARNPDIVHRHNASRRARLAGCISEEYSRGEILSAMPYCLSCFSTINLHIDHVVPVSRGGDDVVGNLQVLCARCNLEKHATYHEYRPTYLLPSYV